MQLLPATFAAQHVGNNIFDPRQNIFAGTKYLAAQLKKFKTPALALAAYNAGPGNVGRFNGIPPFAETIAYIARVLDFLKSFGGFRAMGGPVGAGRSFVVGERGPELFIPRRNGQVITNDRVDRMISILEQIESTGGLRQHTTNIQTASPDPAAIAEILEIKRRRNNRIVRL